MKKLSVIIPVYNVAPYIEKCARSLFGQTYEEIEYVFVDDCSTDGSVAVLGRVLEDFPMRVAQTRILKTDHNSGPVTARNLALQNATGDLIAFCDSDDWLDEDLYARTVSFFDDGETDMVWLATCGEYADSVSRKFEMKPFDGTARDYLAQAGQIPCFDCLWNKVFRGSALRSVDFEWPESLRTSEDLCLVAQVIPHCRRIRNYAEAYYHYRQRTESLSRARDLGRIFEDVSTVYRILSHRTDPALMPAVFRHLTELILFYGLRARRLDQRAFRKWRGLHRAAGGSFDFRWLNPWGRAYMRLAAVCVSLARLLERCAEGRIELL